MVMLRFDGFIYEKKKERKKEGYGSSDTSQISNNFPDIQDYSGFALDHLEFFWMKYFTNEDRQVDFLKLVMAMSPMLKKAQIELYESVSLEEENELLRDLLQLSFLRASPSAKFIFKRPEGQNLPRDDFFLWNF
ncbi:hypothetical protein Tco_1005226 [Tanacetum coccineum]|uniref:FBD domain-containing protein n=1 Tax=Tanacetum coccineum TaxID=301880 RepID=A0ABQ5FEP1_9ASTR